MATPEPGKLSTEGPPEGAGRHIIEDLAVRPKASEAGPNSDDGQDVDSSVDIDMGFAESELQSIRYTLL